MHRQNYENINDLARKVEIAINTKAPHRRAFCMEKIKLYRYTNLTCP